MDGLPADCARVLEGFCGAREIGFSLGAASKSWKPDEETWRRLAARNPLTQLAHVMVDWSTWCAELHGMRRADANAPHLGYRWVENAHRFHSDVGVSAINPVPRFVLQILQDGVVKGTKPLDLWLDISYGSGGDPNEPSNNMSCILGGTKHSGFDVRHMVCQTCKRMETGQPVTDSLGVTICRGSTLQFRIVALPTDSMGNTDMNLHCVLATAPGFAPTIIFDKDFTPHQVATFIQWSRDRGHFAEADPRSLRCADYGTGSSEYGLVGHHPALCFFPMYASRNTALNPPNPHWSVLEERGCKDPACIVRLAAGPIRSDPIIDEFYWEFRSPFLQHIQLNRIRANDMS